VRLLFWLGSLAIGGSAFADSSHPLSCYALPGTTHESCEPVHTRYVAELLEARRNYTSHIALDVWHDLAALDNSFRVPVDHLTATADFLSEWLREAPSPPTPLAVASLHRRDQRAAVVREHPLGAASGRAVECLFMEKRRAAGQGYLGEQIVVRAGGRPVPVRRNLWRRARPSEGRGVISRRGSLRVSARRHRISLAPKACAPSVRPISQPSL